MHHASRGLNIGRGDPPVFPGIHLSRDVEILCARVFNTRVIFRFHPDKKITVTLLCKDQLTDVIAFLREQVQTQHAAEKEAG